MRIHHNAAKKEILCTEQEMYEVWVHTIIQKGTFNKARTNQIHAHVVGR